MAYFCARLLESGVDGDTPLQAVRTIGLSGMIKSFLVVDAERLASYKATKDSLRNSGKVSVLVNDEPKAKD